MLNSFQGHEWASRSLTDVYYLDLSDRHAAMGTELFDVYEILSGALKWPGLSLQSSSPSAQQASPRDKLVQGEPQGDQLRTGDRVEVVPETLFARSDSQNYSFGTFLRREGAVGFITLDKSNRLIQAPLALIQTEYCAAFELSELSTWRCLDCGKLNDLRAVFCCLCRRLFPLHDPTRTFEKEVQYLSLPFAAFASEGKTLDEALLDLLDHGASESDHIRQSAINVASATHSTSSALNLIPTSGNRTNREKFLAATSDESKAFSALSFRVRLSRHCHDDIRNAEALPSGFQGELEALVIVIELIYDAAAGTLGLDPDDVRSAGNLLASFPALPDKSAAYSNDVVFPLTTA